MERDKAVIVAERLIGWLRPACERIEIAGSVRRGKPEVKDIEIMAVPKSEAPKPVFGQRQVFPRMIEQVLHNMEFTRGLVEPVKGGEKYKQFWLLEGKIHVIKVDLFLVTPPAQWGVQMVIRTGPAEFSQWMVTQRYKSGALPDDYFVENGAVWDRTDASAPIPMPEEKDFFELCGLEWMDPAKREMYRRKHG